MKNPLFQDTSRVHVFRGGSWYYYARDSRVFFRYWNRASYRYDYQGLRIFRSQEKS